jgi:hypothetical protein
VNSLQVEAISPNDVHQSPSTQEDRAVRISQALMANIPHTADEYAIDVSRTCWRRWLSQCWKLLFMVLSIDWFYIKAFQSLLFRLRRQFVTFIVDDHIGYENEIQNTVETNDNNNDEQIFQQRLNGIREEIESSQCPQIAWFPALEDMSYRWRHSTNDKGHRGDDEKLQWENIESNFLVTIKCAT